MGNKREEVVPIRKQYLSIKERYPNMILLFRLGDFYEAFEEDAKILSKELKIVLTFREMGKGKKFPMAGIPYHSLEFHLSKLISKGYKVAICEQIGEPKKKGLIEREVVRVVTPGTVLEPTMLKLKANNYLASLICKEEKAGIAYIDITTGEFQATELEKDKMLFEIERLNPAEILLPESLNIPDSEIPSFITRLDDQDFDPEATYKAILENLDPISLNEELRSHQLAIRAAGAIILYLLKTQPHLLPHPLILSLYYPNQFMILDTRTRRNLELIEPCQLNPNSKSLLSIIDMTKTPMGGRLLRKWLTQPLLDINEIEKRQEVVEFFLRNRGLRKEVSSSLERVGDIERLVMRARMGIINPKEIVQLRMGLEEVPKIKTLLEEAKAPALILFDVDESKKAAELIRKAISDDPPSKFGEGVIRGGFSPELDRLIEISKNAKKYLSDLEQRERERTGIKSLKVKFNKVFGYYIEVTTPNLPLVPPDYIRKQTLVGAERFFTPELKEYESIILNSEERIAELEEILFRQVCQQIGRLSEGILKAASALMRIDVFISFAEAAEKYNYTRPKLSLDDVIEIKEGRHPVVERTIEGRKFVPNDTYLSNNDCQIIILTGPNMSGKSTYLRQVALIVILAQIGSFVPAKEAHIGIVDRIFTRIGLLDDIASGRSTFMVEMEEMADILKNATPRSLILLDEVGRGTSTYDGISLAYAIVEYLHSHPKIGAKTLFATHYHELVELERRLQRVRNFNVSVAEEGGKIVFCYKVVRGGTDKSYGIHVAELAGLPLQVVRRAQEILRQFERGSTAQKAALETPESYHPLLVELANIEPDALSPLEALTKIYELSKKAKERLGWIR